MSLSLSFFSQLKFPGLLLLSKVWNTAAKLVKKNENGESWGKNEICDASRQL